MGVETSLTYVSVCVDAHVLACVCVYAGMTHLAHLLALLVLDNLPPGVLLVSLLLFPATHNVRCPVGSEWVQSVHKVHPVGTDSEQCAPGRTCLSSRLSSHQYQALKPAWIS